MDILLSQLSDVFRIGLIVALVVTTLKTSAVTGKVLPLALGVVFVAVMLPTTMPSGSTQLSSAILMGLVSNAIILLLVLAAAKLIAQLRR
jgi:hypothetical protein